LQNFKLLREVLIYVVPFKVSYYIILLIPDVSDFKLITHERESVFFAENFAEN
jgi:hypothetical protein